MDDAFFKKCQKGVASWARLSELDLMRFGYLVFKKTGKSALETCLSHDCLLRLHQRGLLRLRRHFNICRSDC